MIKTIEDLENISETKSVDNSKVESLTYIPPNSVVDIDETKELAYQLYIDEDKKRWNFNTQASIIIGANALLVAVLGTLFSGEGLFIVGAVIFIPFLISIISSIKTIALRSAYRPVITGDTAEKLGMTRDEYVGVIAYTYADNFFLNRKENEDKIEELELAFLTFKITLGLAILASAILLLVENWDTIKPIIW